ncbi:MAG: AMP-binding protein [Clostridia bacterium]|nr:AMP-binding protein [Clostridia bacterium]MDQ7790888.1 AMP-binding protein [Clostridia bacterium]
MQDHNTIPKLLVRNASLYGNKTALREKEYGIWQSVSWTDYLEHVRRFALGLAALGFGHGDKLAIIGDNRPEWVYAELAAQALGGVAVGIYQDSLPKEIAYVIDHSDARLIVVEDQEQVDKMLEIKSEMPKVEKVVFYDEKGMKNYQDPLLISFPEMEELGEAFGRDHPDYFLNEVAKGSGADPAIISYTSGTTGTPKGAVLSHDNLLSMAKNLLSLDPLTARDEFLSFLPLAWAGEQMMSISAALWSGMTVNFPEEPETVQENLKEIGPHVMFSPPRIWEDMVSKVQVKIDDSRWLKRLAYRTFMPIGYRAAEARFAGRSVPLGLRALYFLGDLIVFSAIKDHLGLVKLKRAYTGGAALGPDVFRFFHALGVNLKQIYGQTEIAGISVIHRDGAIKFNTVGVPILETEVRLADDGEIISRSPSVFLGYYKDPEATARTLVDGWLYSGDAGYLDEDGHLIVIDRIKDVMRLQDGTAFSPQFIENKLKFSQYVKEAVVLGQNRGYVTAMINIEMGNVGKYAEKNQIPYTTYVDLTQKEVVLELIAREVAGVNKDLPEAVRIKRFVVLHKELDADDEELTRTRKVRRGFVAEKYKVLVDALYGTQDVVNVETEVKYRDGRMARIQTSLKVMQIEQVG